MFCVAWAGWLVGNVQVGENLPFEPLATAAGNSTNEYSSLFQSLTPDRVKTKKIIIARATIAMNRIQRVLFRAFFAQRLASTRSLVPSLVSFTALLVAAAAEFSDSL